MTSIRLDIKDQKTRKDFEEIISTITDFQLHKYSDDPKTCDLWVLEIGEDVKKEFELIRTIKSFGAEKEVFLTSSRLDSDLLIQALRAGAKEFFSQPIKKDEVKDALSKYLECREYKKPVTEKKKRGKIIDVIGSKGGVGTTTVAVNVATSLAQSEGSPLVALVDMNLLFGEIPVFLDLESGFNWAEVARNISRLDSTYLMSILTKHTSGVYVLPSPTGLDGVNVATPEIIEKLFEEMRQIFDFVVIDGGQSIDEISFKIFKIADKILLISILSLPCLTNVKRLLWIFKRLGNPSEENIHIIISRYIKKSDISIQEAERSITKEIFWIVPNDYLTTMSAINLGKTLSTVSNGSEISKNFVALAAKFKEPMEKGKEKAKAGIFEKILSARK